MKHIYIVLTNTGTLFSKSIQRYTQAPFNHASLSLDANLDELYSFGRKHAKNPFRAGFVKEDVCFGVYRYFPYTTCAIYELTISEVQFQTICEIVQEFNENKHRYRYNLIGLFGFLINRPIAFQNMYFCSQFVCEALKKSDICMQNEHPPLIAPDDFRTLLNGELIYEGALLSYPPVVEKSKQNVLVNASFSLKKNKKKRSFSHAPHLFYQKTKKIPRTIFQLLK